MARQLVGISQMFPYMFWARITHLCVNPSIYNITMRSHQGAAGLSATATIKQNAHVRDDYEITCEK